MNILGDPRKLYVSYFDNPPRDKVIVGSGLLFFLFRREGIVILYSPSLPLIMSSMVPYSLMQMRPHHKKKEPGRNDGWLHLLHAFLFHLSHTIHLDLLSRTSGSLPAPNVIKNKFYKFRLIGLGRRIAFYQFHLFYIYPKLELIIYPVCMRSQTYAFMSWCCVFALNT